MYRLYCIILSIVENYLHVYNFYINNISLDIIIVGVRILLECIYEHIIQD